MGEKEEFTQAIHDLQDALENSLRAFAKWFAREWKLGGRKDWEKAFSEPYSEEFVRGYNAAVESAEDAVECFLGEP